MTTQQPAPLETRTMPGLGQQLLYRLNAADVSEIESCRAQSLAASLAAPVAGPVLSGNNVFPGDIYVAIVVRCRSLDPVDGINLRVLLDGNHDLWAELRTEGDVPGTWHWPDI